MKYFQLEKCFLLSRNRDLNILVVNDFKHRFLVVKVVMENGIGKQIDLQAGDRIVALNSVTAPQLTLKRMRQLLDDSLKKNESALMRITVLRKFHNKNVADHNNNKKLMSPKLSRKGLYAPNTPVPNREIVGRYLKISPSLSLTSPLNQINRSNYSRCEQSRQSHLSNSNGRNQEEELNDEYQEPAIFVYSTSPTTNNTSRSQSPMSLCTSTPIRNNCSKLFDTKMEDILICSREFLNNKENYRPKNLDNLYDNESNNNNNNKKSAVTKPKQIVSNSVAFPSNLAYLTTPENLRSNGGRRNPAISLRTRRQRAFQLLPAVNESNLITHTTRL